MVTGVDGRSFELTDLPGMYSLKPNTIDEEVALKHLDSVRATAHLVFVIDGNNLEQELVMPLMLHHKGLTVAVAVNMMDEVAANGKQIDMALLRAKSGLEFFPISAKLGEGVDALKERLFDSHGKSNARAVLAPSIFGHLDEEFKTLHKAARDESRKLSIACIKQGRSNLLLERDLRIDTIILHRVFGPILFFVVMFVLFQSIFTWATPISDGILFLILKAQVFVRGIVPVPFLASLFSDGVLAGVGAVLAFVPQIAILFFLVGLLEFSGYLPRIAYMVDRLMKPFGLDGKVFIPLLSSVACAVPGIMATRTIENERTRITTIMISPLMTCSARLPVYTLLISTFIPATRIWGLSLPGLVMFGMYLLGTVTALFVALVIHLTGSKKKKNVIDLIHLPHYRAPDWRLLGKYVWGRISVFLRKAGTVIAAMSILLWALLSFPRDDAFRESLKEPIAHATLVGNATMLSQLQNQMTAKDLENSAGGRLGKFLEPVFQPIGYDWKLTIGILSSLAAREVFVSTLGTVFSLGKVDGEVSSLTDTLRAEKDSAGKPKYTLATCLSLLVFFAFSLQCISTITVAHRETNSWRIPATMFVYMFVLAYTAAFVLYQVTTLLLK
jgi:ferrous iron transport protein B